MQPHSRAALLLSLVLALCMHACDAVKLKFATQECMEYELHMYTAFYGSYVALPDANNHLAQYMLTITAPSSTKVFENQYVSEAKFNVVPYETGRYRFCLTIDSAQRGLSRYIMQRDVVWDLHIAGADLHHGHAKEDETEHLWQLVNQIDQQVQQLRSTQQYLYWRERRHRQTVDSTNWRVWWYAMLRNAALIATSVAQVLFVRRMFAKS